MSTQISLAKNARMSIFFTLWKFGASLLSQPVDVLSLALGIICKSGRHKLGDFILFFVREKASFQPSAYSYGFFSVFSILRTDTMPLIDRSLPPQCLQSAPFLPPQKLRPAWRPRNMTCCSARGWWTCGRMASLKGQLGRSFACLNPPCTASSSSTASATRWRTCHATDGPKNPDLKEQWMEDGRDEVTVKCEGQKV